MSRTLGAAIRTGVSARRRASRAEAASGEPARATGARACSQLGAGLLARGDPLDLPGAARRAEAVCAVGGLAQRAGRRPSNPGDWRDVVVAGRLSRSQRRNPLLDRQRDPDPDRTHRPPRASLRHFAGRIPVLFDSGVSRSSAKIIDEQTANVASGNSQSIDAMHELKVDAIGMKECMLNAERFGYVPRQPSDERRRACSSRRRRTAPPSRTRTTAS